jgi:ParB family chromosome partitioning protein
MRKEFTVSERVAIAQAVAEKMPNRHGGDRKSDQAGNISGLIEKGETKDIAAAKAGLGSGKTYEAAKKVVMEGAPELVKAMDEGKVTITVAEQKSATCTHENDGMTE